MVRTDSKGDLVLYRDYAKLKAEVERLTAFTTRTIIPNEELQAENARLKAEVERLDTLCKQLSRQHSDISCENIMLREAGDEMAHKLENYGNYYLTSQWEDAKEGKFHG